MLEDLADLPVYKTLENIIMLADKFYEARGCHSGCREAEED